MNLLLSFRKVWKQSQLEFSYLSVHTEQADTLAIFIPIRWDNQINNMETESGMLTFLLL